MTALLATQRKNILIAGIETHICVFQTAADLKESNYNVQVVEDAVSFRTLANKQLGLEKMKALGILGTSVEFAIYELLKSAAVIAFKQVLKIIKYIDSRYLYECMVQEKNGSNHFFLMIGTVFEEKG